LVTAFSVQIVRLLVQFYYAVTNDWFLPESLDVLLLTIGADGHIASIYPGSSALQEK